ncbi:Sec-independent protein translocase subunit TatB [uncultured Corynebacterium sp.]|uniref:Sec-independent protein translocase subunit TatB n=1 Tax=uncultured Corynebacterium sp. TaxID=159447 RepID=UPI0025EF637D|nr:Sec-independent protein translocase subunit TatB [uncultured Corynebacterium sp.]
MFSNVGWGEILLLFIVGLVIVGPERLPRLIEDVKAAIFAARTAINNAKENLDTDFGEEFDEIRKPISQIAQIRSMSPKTAITRALFDDDNEFLDSFDPKKIMADETAGKAHRKQVAKTGEEPERTQVVERPEQPEQNKDNGPAASGGGYSWTDII